LTDALVAAVPDGPCPVRWTGRQAVVTLPEHIGVSNSGQIREQLLELVNRGAAVLIADMTGTVSCDHGGADALLRVYQRASVSGTRLRVAVTAQIVRRVLDASGLDRLVSIYPSVQAAIAAGTPGVIPLVPRPGKGQGEDQVSLRRRRAAAPRNRSQAAGVTPAVLWGLVDALDDGVVLTDDDGVLVLANRRAEDMFGYVPGELIGQPVESLVPADLRAAHISQRAGYAQQPTARPMAARARLPGQRKDGSTFPVRVSLSPVPRTCRALTWPIWPAPLPQQNRRAAAGCSWTGWSTASSTSASACRPRLTCPMMWPCSRSPTPCAAWTTRSARSKTTCSLTATMMDRPIPPRGTDRGEITAPRRMVPRARRRLAARTSPHL
jgi:anti-anti-sigma factor